MTYRYPFSFSTKPLGFTRKGGFVSSPQSRIPISEDLV